MITFHRICIKSHSVTDTQGTHFEVKRGQEYLTSEEKDGRVTVFSKYWVQLPANIFAGEQQFTDDSSPL